RAWLDDRMSFLIKAQDSGGVVMPLSLTSAPIVSFLISTYNRKAVLLDMLNRIGACGLDAQEFEIIVVDNASPDGTADAVAAAFPHVHLIRLDRNVGPTAKNLALAQ